MTTLARPRRTWYVDLMRGFSRRTGKSDGRAFDVIQDAIDAADPGDLIKIAGFSQHYDDGSVDGYNEALTISAQQSGLVLVGAIRELDWAPRGSVFVKPTTTDAVPLTNHGADVTLVNIGLQTNGSGTGLINTGDRLRCEKCKIEGGSLAAQLTLGTVAEIAAKSKGKGSDVLLDDCEIAWATTGIKLTGSNYGAVTQARIRKGRFHNLTAASLEESFGTGGTVSEQYRNLLVDECVFDADEAGTQPTKYLSLNDSNVNTGVAMRNSFPTALTGGKNLVSTLLLWVGNYHPAGISTGQPS